MVDIAYLSGAFMFASVKTQACHSSRIWKERLRLREVNVEVATLEFVKFARALDA